jgi:hypothetical protein
MVTGVVAVHAVAGAVALASMVVPLATRKGSPRHRQGGRVYAGAMTVVVLGAWVACGLRLAAGERVGQSWFLALLALQSAGSVWTGFAALRPPRRVDLAVAGVVTVAGLFGGTYGLRAGQPLLLGFGALTTFLGVQAVRAATAPHPSARERVAGHLAGMLAACISTVTAFLVVNARWMPEAVPPWLPWVVPTVLGVPTLLRWSSRWRAGHTTFR